MKECIAMLLAGGQGSRLYALTKKLAKPAVPFGGKYRIIDFPAVQLCQFRHRHSRYPDAVPAAAAQRVHRQRTALGSGPPVRRRTCAAALSDGQLVPTGTRAPPTPFTRTSTSLSGTTPSMCSSCPATTSTKWIMPRCWPIHKEQQRRLHHRRAGGALGGGVSRFGIMTADENGVITKFEEKPKEPKSNLASMGIYIFTWEKLRKYLDRGRGRQEQSSNDFGKNIIPNDAGATSSGWLRLPL